jgi:CPA1 family monovalent cation:H+ antiporter
MKKILFAAIILINYFDHKVYFNLYPSIAVRLKKKNYSKNYSYLNLGGLRGGISIALALSIAL